MGSTYRFLQIQIDNANQMGNVHFDMQSVLFNLSNFFTQDQPCKQVKAEMASLGTNKAFLQLQA